MSLKINDIVGNIFYTDRKEKAEQQQRSADLQQRTNNVFGQTENPADKLPNPFLNKNGELFNPNLNYQKILDNENVSAKTKEYIQKATGLSPTAPKQTTQTTQTIQGQTPAVTPVTGSGIYTGSVGKKIANTESYNNSAAKGQCVWFVRGRMNEKFGKDTGSIGNANQMWYNAKPEAKLSASADNIKPDTIASYKYGSGGSKYGHVIYIEDVVGDTVYYTEGGTYHTKNGTTGVVKTASKSEILNGSKLGQELIGFIDVSKY